MVDTEMYLTAEDNLVLNQLREHGEAWIVGGWVRETLMMSKTKSDLDIATTLLPREVIEIFPRTIPVGEEFGTVIVRLDGESEGQWEVTTLRKDGSYGDGRRPDNVSFGKNIIEDLARRDFTINAMAIGSDNQLIDIFGGKNDLSLNIVRAVGNANKRLAEDGLRILRAFRFLEMGRENLRALDSELEVAIKENIEMLEKVSKERITDEIRKILSNKNSYGIFLKMKELGVLNHILDGLSVEVEDLGDADSMVIFARFLRKNKFDEEQLTEILKKRLTLTKKEIRQISFLYQNRNLKFDKSIESIRRFQVLLSEEQKTSILQYHNEGENTEKYRNQKNELQSMQPILNGTKISEITGIKPSRKLGLLKDWLFRIQIEKNIHSENKMKEILDEINWNDLDPESWPKLSWP